MKIIKFWVFIGIFLIAVCSGINCGTNSDNPISLNGEVIYDEGFFTIINRDSFRWEKVKYYLNFEGDNLTSGYTFSDPLIHAEVLPDYAVGISDFEFENSKGQQFHSTLPLEAPFKLLIQAETPDGRTGTYLKTWENPDKP